MSQRLHGRATTTHATRQALQRSTAPAARLAREFSLNRKTVAKWRARAAVEDAPMGPKQPRSASLSPEEEATAVAFRRYTLLPPWATASTRCSCASPT